jgi:hypothetical protein
LFAAAVFIIGFLSGGNFLKMSDDMTAVGDYAGSHAALGDGRQNLLGAPASDAQQRLEGGPVDPRLGILLELANSFREAIQPEGFIRHFSKVRYPLKHLYVRCITYRYIIS